MSERQLKKLIFYQEQIKEQIKKFYIKDIKTFNKEYGVLLVREALYNAKLKNLNSNNEDQFIKDFVLATNKIVIEFFNKKNGSLLTTDKLLDLLQMQRELEQVKKFNQEKFQQFYNINRIKANKLIYEVAFRRNFSSDNKISMIDKLRTRQIDRIIENNDDIDDLKSTYIVLKIANISLNANKLLNIHLNKIIDFTVNAGLVSKIKKFLFNSKILLEKALINNLVIGKRDKKFPITIDFLQGGEARIHVESSNRSLLNYLTYMLSNAIQPPPLKVKIIEERSHRNELKNIPIDKISILQLVD